MQLQLQQLDEGQAAAHGQHTGQDEHLQKTQWPTGQAGDERERVNGRHQPQRGNAHTGQARQQNAEREIGAQDAQQRPPGPGTDFVAALGLDHRRLEYHQGANERQQRPQHQRKVARPHAGAFTNVVVGRAPCKGDAYGEVQQAGEEILLTLDAHESSPRRWKIPVRIVTIGNAVFDVDFNRFVAFHKQHGGLVTLFTHPNSHPYDSGLIIADKNGAVERWLAKEDERPEYYRNRVNAGLHVINPSILDHSGIDADKVGAVGENGKPIKVDLDRQILKPLCGSNMMFCYDSPEYVKDMGTPERFHQVEADYKNGVVQAKNLTNKQKAIFLDRDGTINKYVGFLRNIDDFELIEGVAEAIKLINQSGYLAIVVTNQPVIARGEVTWEELNEIHKKMATLLGKEGAYVDGIYICPHHPDKGFEGERPEYKIDCDCRKPKPGLLLQAAKDFNIDLSESYMIGDSHRDVEAGENAGVKKSIKVEENSKNSLLKVFNGIKKN